MSWNNRSRYRGNTHEYDYSFSSKTTNPFNQPEVPSPPKDTVSKLSWCPIKPILCASSWDNSVSAWEVNHTGGFGGPNKLKVDAKPLVRVFHKAPALCVFCSRDGRIFSGGCDNIAKVTGLPGVNIGTGNTQNNSRDFGMHDSPIKTIHHVPEKNLILTGGWDNKIRYWDDRLRNNQHIFEFKLPERVYCADVKKNIYVVCCGGKKKEIGIFDLRTPQKVMRNENSNLRHQTKSVSVLPDCSGYIYGGIEGRGSVKYFDDSPNSGNKNFSFKCHRESPKKKGPQYCYSVNDISFDPQRFTCATAGSNGRFCFWNLKTQIRVYQLGGLKKFSMPLTCGQFSPDGKFYAIALGYDFSQGTDSVVYKQGGGSKIILQFNFPRMHKS